MHSRTRQGAITQQDHDKGADSYEILHNPSDRMMDSETTQGRPDRLGGLWDARPEWAISAAVRRVSRLRGWRPGHVSLEFGTVTTHRSVISLSVLSPRKVGGCGPLSQDDCMFSLEADSVLSIRPSNVPFSLGTGRAE